MKPTSLALSMLFLFLVSQVVSGGEIAKQLNGSGMKGFVTKIPAEPFNPLEELEATLEFDWTNCRIHCAHQHEDVEFRLTGRIDTPFPAVIQLWSGEEAGGGFLALNFVEDVLGREGVDFGMNIPIEWSLSLNGGPQEPLEIWPPGVMGFQFPPGQHEFELIAMGLVTGVLDDGYYYLQIHPILVPLL